MYASQMNQNPEIADQISVGFVLSPALEAQPEPEIAALMDKLSPSVSWGERQSAARKLGRMHCLAAVPALMAVLPSDPYWMVRCAIVQALQMIGDRSAVPLLEEVAIRDRYQAVRSYAAKAVERLS
jgi:HEAT repeat protein